MDPYQGSQAMDQRFIYLVVDQNEKILICLSDRIHAHFLNLMVLFNSQSSLFNFLASSFVILLLLFLFAS